MALVTTLEPIYWPLMDAPSVRLDRCAVCGAPGPLEQHHVVRRSQGQLVRDGKALPKPTVTLCGMGSNLGDGHRLWCHGMAHHHLLHLRYTERGWEWLRTREPTRYDVALTMGGWRRLGES